MTMALFTMVKDEDYFLPLWLKHYMKLFNPRDIYVLNNGSPFEFEHNLINRIPVKHPYMAAFDLNWMRDTVCDFQVELLKRYDWVLFAEADEFITAPPGKETRFILDSIQQGAYGQADVIQMQSRDIVHDPLREAELDTTKGFLSQRVYWMHRMIMDKPTLARVPVRYIPGFHAFESGHFHPYISCPDLYLMHMAKVDYNAAKNRTGRRMQWEWSRKELLDGISMYHRIPQEMFDSWFFDGMVSACSYIPMQWRLVI